MTQEEIAQEAKKTMTPLLLRDLNRALRAQYSQDEDTVIGFYIAAEDYYGFYDED